MFIFKQRKSGTNSMELECRRLVLSDSGDVPVSRKICDFSIRFENHFQDFSSL